MKLKPCVASEGRGAIWGPIHATGEIRQNKAKVTDRKYVDFQLNWRIIISSIIN
jgi:hypothetical protein